MTSSFKCLNDLAICIGEVTGSVSTLLCKGAKAVPSIFWA
jgi:hypothetical protein